MVRFLLNKIGRDKGAKSFKSQGITCEYKILKGPEWGNALKAKLIEETQEVRESVTQQEIIAELADVLEVINGLCKAYNISLEDIEKIKKQKYLERGGFEEGFYIKSIEMDENNPRIEHFRKSPDKYPETK